MRSKRAITLYLYLQATRNNDIHDVKFIRSYTNRLVMSSLDDHNGYPYPTCSEKLSDISSRGFIKHKNVFCGCDKFINSSDQPKTNLDKKCSIKSKSQATDTNRDLLSKYSHITFAYLYHLVSFSWRRRKRRNNIDLKYNKQTLSLYVVKFLSFNILSALVLICSSCIATTNASTSLKSVHMSSSHSSLNNASFVSKTHHLVHHDRQVSKETAHLFSNVYEEDLVEHSAKLSRSRKPRGKNKLFLFYAKESLSFLYNNLGYAVFGWFYISIVIQV